MSESSSVRGGHYRILDEIISQAPASNPEHPPSSQIPGKDDILANNTPAGIAITPSTPPPVIPDTTNPLPDIPPLETPSKSNRSRTSSHEEELLAEKTPSKRNAVGEGVREEAKFGQRLGGGLSTGGRSKASDVDEPSSSKPNRPISPDLPPSPTRRSSLHTPSSLRPPGSLISAPSPGTGDVKDPSNEEDIKMDSPSPGKIKPANDAKPDAAGKSGPGGKETGGEGAGAAGGGGGGGKGKGKEVELEVEKAEAEKEAEDEELVKRKEREGTDYELYGPSPPLPPANKPVKPDNNGFDAYEDEEEKEEEEVLVDEVDAAGAVDEKKGEKAVEGDGSGGDGGARGARAVKRLPVRANSAPAGHAASGSAIPLLPQPSATLPNATLPTPPTSAFTLANLVLPPVFQACVDAAHDASTANVEALIVKLGKIVEDRALLKSGKGEVVAKADREEEGEKGDAGRGSEGRWEGPSAESWNALEDNVGKILAKTEEISSAIGELSLTMSY